MAEQTVQKNRESFKVLMREKLETFQKNNFMKKETVLIVSELITSLFALILIFLISAYTIKENIDAVFYFQIMPIIILLIGFIIFRHGIRIKK